MTKKKAVFRKVKKTAKKKVKVKKTEKRELKLIPLLAAWNFPSEVDGELGDNDISTHYAASVFDIDWDDEEEYQEMRKWLEETYGQEIKVYSRFAIDPT